VGRAERISLLFLLRKASVRIRDRVICAISPAPFFKDILPEFGSILRRDWQRLFFFFQKNRTPSDRRHTFHLVLGLQLHLLNGRRVTEGTEALRFRKESDC